MGNHRNHGVSCVLCGHEKTVGRKLCRRCYYKEVTKGTIQNFPHTTLADTFMNRVRKTESCWIWTGTTNQYGYGIVLVDKKSKRAHRVSYEIHKGEIPSDMVVMHSCDTPACVNPDHLSIGTKLDNNRDCKEKRRNAFGERNGHAKVTDEQIDLIRTLPFTQVQLAQMFGITQSQISRIISGKRRSQEKR